MNESIRYDKGLGNSEVYARVVNNTQFYNFSTVAWVDSEVSGCRIFLTEYPDSSTTQSWYAENLPAVPVGGPYGVDIVRLSSGDTIGNDLITQSTDVVLPIDDSVIKAQDIFDVVLQRLAAIKKPIQLDFYGSLNATIDIIFRRLLLRQSDIIQGSFSQAVVAPATTITLPADFFGFSERPYISGTKCLLNPLPSESKMSFTEASTPRYYELRGKTATLYPTPSQNVTILAQYYKKPVKITAFTDNIPFNGLFDFAIQEAVIDVCQMGMAVVIDKNFMGILYKQIDEVLSFRTPKQVGFFQTIEGGQRIPTSPYYF